MATDDNKGSNRKTQAAAILRRMIEAHGGEVPSYELAGLALQYSARLRELRVAGHNIVSRTERRNGKVCGWFRLVLGAPTPSATTVSARSIPLEPVGSKDAEPPQQARLFPPVLQRYCDPEER